MKQLTLLESVQAVVKAHWLVMKASEDETNYGAYCESLDELDDAVIALCSAVGLERRGMEVVPKSRNAHA